MRRQRARDAVLIPLNSGLAWSRQRAARLRGSTSLNPFEFRAGLEHTCQRGVVARQGVLIPLNSGLAWSSVPFLYSIVVLGLNPFEFRAGLEHEIVAGQRVVRPS